MCFGDCLKQKLQSGDFLKCENKKFSKMAFWVVLRDVAVEDLKACAPQKIDSDRAVSIYYDILDENMDFLPDFICDVVPSNGQAKFRVANRNLFTSNAFHPDGLGNQKGVCAEKVYNEGRKGEKIIFQYVEG